jgi:hypothetical protein
MYRQKEKKMTFLTAFQIFGKRADSKDKTVRGLCTTTASAKTQKVINYIQAKNVKAKLFIERIAIPFRSL